MSIPFKSMTLNYEQLVNMMTRVYTADYSVGGLCHPVPINKSIAPIQCDVVPDWEANGSMGWLDGKRVIVDPHLTLQPRVQVTKKFRELQSSKLVAETNEWMDKFFGRDYPIYVEDHRIIIHPHTFSKYKQQVPSW